MGRFEAMRTLVAAVDEGSLSGASRALGLPLPTVSRRVSDLETQLGTQLVVRTSRRLLLTETGAAYVAAVRRVLEEVEAAEKVASGEYRTPRGTLIVTAPRTFGRLHVAPAVHAFLRSFAEVYVRLVLSDSVIDIVGNQIDAAIRIGDLPASSLKAKRLGHVRWVVCASPDYLREHGVPRDPSDLDQHDCIAFEGLDPDRDWPFTTPDGRTIVTVRPRYSVNASEAVIAAAADGLGLACVMSYQAADSFRDGTLVRVLASWAPPPVPVQVVYADRQSQPMKLRAFIEDVSPRIEHRLRSIADLFDTESKSGKTR